MSGLLEGVLSRPRWRESWVSPHSVWLDHGSDGLLELEKRMKQSITYLEGREKRNRRRSVDRIEGQSENQRGVGQATRDSGRLRMSFEDRETSSLSYPEGQSRRKRATRSFPESTGGRVTWASYCRELESANQQGDVFFLCSFFFFCSPRGDLAAKWSRDGGWRRRWAAMGMYKVMNRMDQVRGSKALRQRVRKQSLELFVRVEILFWLRGLCLCDSEDAAQSGPGAGYPAVPGCWRHAAEVPAATATAQGSTNKQGVKKYIKCSSDG